MEITAEDKLKAKKLDEILKEYNVSEEEYKVNEVYINKWEGQDSSGNKIPLYQTKVKLKPKLAKEEKLAIEELKEDLKSWAPKKTEIDYNKPCEGDLMLVIPLKDIHFGKLCWEEETGMNYDISIAEKIVSEMIHSYIAYSSPFHHRIQKIVFEVGNDFFNSDNKLNTTSAGTPQSEDTRWRKTFREGRKIIVDAIERLKEIAPVEVIVIPGNHDEERSFYLGDALECWYHNDLNVVVNNKATSRKAVLYGNNLLVFLHGDKEKKNLLVQTVALEFSNVWGSAKHKEIIMGHFHQENVYTEAGVIIRTVGSPSPPDQWHFDKQYVGIPSGQAFIYDKVLGNIFTIRYTVPEELYG